MNMQKLMMEAQKMQKKLQNEQKELENSSYEGNSSLVKVVVNGGLMTTMLFVFNAKLQHLF